MNVETRQKNQRPTVRAAPGVLSVFPLLLVLDVHNTNKAKSSNTKRERERDPCASVYSFLPFFTIKIPQSKKKKSGSYCRAKKSARWERTNQPAAAKMFAASKETAEAERFFFSTITKLHKNAADTPKLCAKMHAHNMRVVVACAAGAYMFKPIRLISKEIARARAL